MAHTRLLPAKTLRFIEFLQERLGTRPRVGRQLRHGDNDDDTDS